MISHDELYDLIHTAFPDASIDLKDLTGGQDHWQAQIVSSAFEGLREVSRHRKVYAALGEYMHGPIHALSLRTLTPGEAE